MRWLKIVFGSRKGGAIAIRRVNYDGKLRGFWCMDAYFNIHQVSSSDSASLSKVMNLEVTKEGIKGKYHSIDRIYTVDELTGATSGHRIQVIHVKESKVDGRREYTVVSDDGNVEELSEEKLIALTERVGGTNYKLVEREGKKFLAPLTQWYSRELLETRIWNKEEVLRLKDSMGKRPLDKAVYVYNVGNKKNVERYKLFFKYRLPAEGTSNYNRMEEDLFPELRMSLIDKRFRLKELVSNGKVHPRTAKHYEKSIEAFKNGYVTVKEMDNRILLDYLNYSVLNVANPKNKVKEAKKLVGAHSAIGKSVDKKAATYITAMYADFIQLKRHSKNGNVSKVYPYIHKGMVKRMEMLVVNFDIQPIYEELYKEVKKEG